MFGLQNKAVNLENNMKICMTGRSTIKNRSIISCSDKIYLSELYVLSVNEKKSLYVSQIV